MKTDLLLAQIQQYITLNESEIQYFDSLLIPQSFKQGEPIVSQGEPARYIIYVNEGYLMSYR